MMERVILNMMVGVLDDVSEPENSQENQDHTLSVCHLYCHCLHHFLPFELVVCDRQSRIIVH